MVTSQWLLERVAASEPNIYFCMKFGEEQFKMLAYAAKRRERLDRSFRTAIADSRVAPTHHPQPTTCFAFTNLGFDRTKTAHRILTARAASSASALSEIVDCTIIMPFAHRESTGTSVGENAVLVLNARNR